MKKSIERIVYTAIFTGALLSIQNNLAYAKPGDVYDLSTGFKFAKEHVTSNNSVVSLLEEKIQKGNKIAKELPDSRFIYVEGFKKDYERYLKLNFNQEEALIKAIESNIITNEEELDKIKNSKDFFEQNTSLAVDVNGDIIKVSGNTLEGNLLINVYDTKDNEVYIGHVKNNEWGYYEYAFDFGGNTTGNYKVVVQESILEKKKESNIEYKEQEIKEIPKLEDVSINYGSSYELPKTIEILTEDKGIAEGNHIKNAMVVWDKDFDNKKQGKQEFNGKLLNVTTTQAIQLNIIVGEQDLKEAVNERFKKLDDLMKQDIDFVEEKINTEINKALNSVQEALDNQNLKDEEFKKSMQDKVDIYSDAIDKINTLKTDIESFEELLLNGDFTNKEVNDEYNAYYEKFINVSKNFNKATYTSVRTRKEAAESWYTKNSYEFNEIKYKVISDLYILHRDMTYLEDNEKQERYNKIEEFRTICNNIGDVDKYKFNRATTNSLENIKQDLINKVEAIIVDNGGLKVNKGTETNKIEATFVGIKINDLGSYKIEILDEDQYGNNVKVSADGTITLDLDKGNDDNEKYEQIIVIKDPLWNVQYSIKVAITDNEGKDTFEIVNEKSLTLEEKLQIKMENLNRAFGDDVDLLSFGNIQKGENAIVEAEDIIAQAEKEGIDVSEEKIVVENAKETLREINSVLQQINECNEYIDTEDLSNCRYLEWGEGESRIEEINTKYTEIAYKVYWAGADNPINIEHKLTKLTVEGIRIKLEEINIKHDSIKVNLIIELKSMEELNVLLNEFKEDTTNIEKYNDLNNKLNEPSNYDGLNEATINGFQSKREAIKNELDQITKGIQSTTSSGITIRLDQLSTEKRSKNGQTTSNSDSNSNESHTYLREEDLLGLKRTVIDNIQEFIKKISRKLK